MCHWFCVQVIGNTTMNKEIVDSDMGWRKKASRIIGEYCLAEYNRVNKNKKNKKHVPYSVPEIAEALLQCLNNNDEYEAKRLFIIISTGSFSLI